MSENDFQKETPVGKELFIWFLIATGLALVNWYLSYRPMPDIPASGLRFLVLQLAYSYFVFAHILILIVVFRMVVWDRVKSSKRFIQEGSGLLFAFIGFVFGLYNMEWFAGFIFGHLFPGRTLSFELGGSLWYWLFTFVAIAVIGIFAVSYHTMRLNLKESYRIHLERERLRSELETAREMQMGIMPSQAPQLQGFDIAGICLTATEVGGDYYDYIRPDGDGPDDELAIAVADVSGKGMKAAMTAVMLSGMMNAEAIHRTSPAEVLIHVNRPLFRKSDRRMFAAMLFGILDPRTKQFTFTNAGQMPPLLLRGGKVSQIRSHGPRLPLGAVAEANYARKALPLEPGDHLLLYTDGINEARNGDRLLFGEARLADAFVASADAVTASEALEVIQSRIRYFTHEEPQHDDITMVLLRVS
ncbi:MAG: PP2C family protein-serine/threonine phosphatase [Cyclonatronaceae bacterium]